MFITHICLNDSLYFPRLSSVVVTFCDFSLTPLIKGILILLILLQTFLSFPFLSSAGCGCPLPTLFPGKLMPDHASHSGLCLAPVAHSRCVWDGHRCGRDVPWCWGPGLFVWFACVCVSVSVSASCFNLCLSVFGCQLASTYRLASWWVLVCLKPETNGVCVWFYFFSSHQLWRMMCILMWLTQWLWPVSEEPLYWSVLLRVCHYVHERVYSFVSPQARTSCWTAVDLA